MQTEKPQMGRRVLRRHIWGYAVCLCPTKGKPGLNALNFVFSIGVNYLRLGYLLLFLAGKKILHFTLGQLRRSAKYKNFGY